jgi:MarR family transcriptional regulator for hemolysin
MDTTSPDISRLGFLLHDASRLLRRRFEQTASRFGLSSSQWRLLVRVFKEEGVAQARLAELLEVEPISVSRLIDRMETGGWIERRPDPTDRRVRCIYLTDQSREIFTEMRGVAAGVFEGALTGLDDEQRRATFSALETIISNLNCDEAQPAAASDKAA